MSKHILVVDDDPDVRMLLEAHLKAAGYRVSFATDGMSCIMKAQNDRPDLVVLDLGLPGGDGMTALQRMRNLAHLSDVPVLVFSAREEAEWKSKALAEGAAAYLQKPIDSATLLATVQQLLGDSPPAPMSSAPAGAYQPCPHCGGWLQVSLAPVTVQAPARPQ